MSRRLTTVVLAAFYLLQATWLLHAGVDLVLPTVREAAATIADDCCSSACGCPEDVKASMGCCCIPETAGGTPAKKPAQRSAIEEARCKGVEAAMAQAFTQPVVCAFASLDTPIVDVSAVVLPDFQPFLPDPGTPVDKIPIA